MPKQSKEKQPKPKRVKEKPSRVRRGQAALAPPPPSQMKAAAISHAVEMLLRPVTLEHAQRERIRADFIALYAYYLDVEGLTLDEAWHRLDCDMLGEFYQPADPALWYPLDSAAKVYPLFLTPTRMSVFRVSAYLQEDVVPEALQVALLSTVKRFPVFATALRRGFFWHYLEASRRRFSVRREDAMPCQPIRISGRDTVAFRVQYYKRRISLEVFHVLCDGTGAMAFLKTLVREYLRLMGHEAPLETGAPDIHDTPEPEEWENAFLRVDAADKSEGFFERPAAQIAGRIAFFRPARVLQIYLSGAALRKAAKARAATVTELVAAALFVAAGKSIRRIRAHRRLQMQVPVNMRKLYPSKTVRNFSMYSVLGLEVADALSLQRALGAVSSQLREGASKPALDRMAAMTQDLVNHPVLRNTPLGLKRIALRLFYQLYSERTITTTLSNLGVVPEGYAGQVRAFDFVLGASSVNKASCAMATYGDTAILSITKSTHDTRFEEALCEQLTALGLDYMLEEAAP